MKINGRWGIALIIAIMGCKGGQYCSFEHDFGESMLWKDPLQWSWKIQKNDFPYSLKADLQCAVHYPFDKIPLEWTETFPDGHTVIHELDVVVRNPDGSYNGDKALDYLNFDITLDDHHIYPEHGTYQYSIKPKMGVYEAAPFMVEIEIEAKEIDPH
jgi:hypothetical protein